MDRSTDVRRQQTTPVGCISDPGKQIEAVEVLRKSRDFAAACPEALARLARSMRKVTFDRWDYIFREGEESDAAFAIVDGFVWLTTTRSDGNKHFISELGNGDITGDMTTIAQRPRVATAQAANVVTAWVIPGDELRKAVVSDSGLAYALLLNAVSLALESDEEAAARGAQDVRQRTARTLVDLHERGTNEHGSVAVSHAELAMMVGVARENVSRALSSLRRRRMISTMRRGIVVEDLEALRRVAGLPPA
jgi:CRP/FNR family transcriptional regulator